MKKVLLLFVFIGLLFPACCDDDKAGPREITYYANGGAGGKSMTIVSGSSHIILTPEDAGISREDYFFQHWNSAADGSGISFYPEQDITVRSAMDLYAIWGTEEVAEGLVDPAFTMPYSQFGSYAGRVIKVSNNSTQNRLIAVPYNDATKFNTFKSKCRIIIDLSVVYSGYHDLSMYPIPVGLASNPLKVWTSTRVGDNMELKIDEIIDLTNIEGVVFYYGASSVAPAINKSELTFIPLIE